MKKSMFLCLVAAFIMCATLLVTAQTITANKTGTHDGYYYMFWTNGIGSVSMTLGPGGNYSTAWSNCGNFVCGKGWQTGSPDRIVNFSGSFNGSNNGFLSLYGWTQNPLIEYYVVENYGGWTPPGATSVGFFSSDGGIYNLYRKQHFNQNSIVGIATFYTYWSVRTSRRSSGTITFNNHVNAWAGKGWNMGSSWAFQIMSTEGIESSGNSNVTADSGLNPTATVTPTPIRTPTSTATGTVTGGNFCTPGGSVSVPFIKDGAGEFCWETSALGNYINSWNMDLLEVNGINYTNKCISASGIPKVNNRYVIHYKGSYAWSHFEAK